MSTYSRYTYETFSRKRALRRRQYYFRFVAPNGQVLMQSEGYYNQKDRDDTIHAIKRNSTIARVVEVEK